jgi:hypothetical protein
MDWICNFNKKKQQRHINKLIRRMNKNIEQDSLWKGRFCARQVGSPQWTVYDDKSGAELFIHLLFIDKKTKKVMLKADTVAAWSLSNAYRLWYDMNYFITEWCETWRSGERPSEKNAIDFTNTEVKCIRDMEANQGWSVLLKEIR